MLNRRWTAGVALLFMTTWGHAQSSPNVKMPTALIVLGPAGFEPAKTTLRAGNVLLLLHNRSGEKQVVLHLKDAKGSNVHDVPVIANRYDWQEVVSLSPGQYTLSEAGHSKWVCTITIK